MKTSHYLLALTCTLNLTACGGATKPVWEQEFESPVSASQQLVVDDENQLVRKSRAGGELRTQTFSLDGTALGEQSLSIPATASGTMQETTDGYLFNHPQYVNLVKLDSNMQVQWSYSDSVASEQAWHSGIFANASGNTVYFWNKLRRELVKIDNGNVSATHAIASPEVIYVDIIRAQDSVIAYAVTNQAPRQGYLIGFDADLNATFESALIEELAGASFGDGIAYTANGQLHAMNSAGTVLWTQPLLQPHMVIKKIKTTRDSVQVISHDLSNSVFEPVQTGRIHVESHGADGSLQWHYAHSGIGADLSQYSLDLTALASGRFVLSYNESVNSNPELFTSRTTTTIKHHLLNENGQRIRSITQAPTKIDHPAFCEPFCEFTLVEAGNIHWSNIMDGANGEIVILSSVYRGTSNAAGPYRYRLQSY